ncbi:hypothetical protein [Acidovorax sp.]|uniref:hypothetical protein n=1 Tax=Acidovorax sp. TaxID=1872122 RepID=UPI003D01FC87
MAKQKTLPDAAFNELREIQNIIGMASFAAEARRVLRETQLMAGCTPQLNAQLLRLVEAPFEWLDYPDRSAAVLENVYHRLHLLLDED